MSADFDIYRELLSADGETRKDRDIARAKQDFELYAEDNPAYVGDAKRNGVQQRFMITRSDVQYKYNITAFPGEELFAGDDIECFGEHWIVIETRVGNQVQTTGLMWQCNYEFAFQNFDSQIHKYWGVLDSGVYSTTRTSDPYIQTLNQQYKVYLPYNEHTKLLYEDKRLAVGKWVDSHNNPILSVFQITGRDYISKDYDDGSHLLILNLKSSKYNAEKDNYELGICDYIEEDEEEPTGECKIIGRDTIRAGMARKFTAKFYTNGEDESDVVPVWTVTSDVSGWIKHEEDDYIIITVPNDDSLVGGIITIDLTEASGLHGMDTMKVEVI